MGRKKSTGAQAETTGGSTVFNEPLPLYNDPAPDEQAASSPQYGPLDQGGVQVGAPQYETPLPKGKEADFAKWKQQYAPTDSGQDYDLKGAFLAGVTPDPNSGHMPDTFKKPNHPTFSDQSQYAKLVPSMAGHWEGETYVPPPAFKEDADSPIIDRASGKRVRPPEKELNALVLNGVVGYAPEHKINVVDENGQSFNVPGDTLRLALKNGFTIEDNMKSQAREVAKKSGMTGAAKVALGQFVDEAAFGIPEMILDKYGNEYDVAKKNALKEEHEYANAIGGLAGFATSMAYGGEATGAERLGVLTERAILGQGEKMLARRLATAGVEKAPEVAAGLAKKVIANAAKMGVENTLLQAPVNVTEALLGDPEKAAEHVFENFGVGAILGASGKFLSEAGGGIAKRASGLAETQAARSHFYSRDLKGQKMIEALPGGEKAYGRQMLDDNLLKMGGEDFGALGERVTAKKEEAGTAIRGLYSELDNADSKIKLPTTDHLADRIEAGVIGDLKKTPGNESTIAKVESYLKSFRETGAGRQLSFSEMHDWRSALDDKIWKEGQIGVQDSAKKELVKVRDFITKELESKGEQVAKEQGTTFVDRLQELNLKYRQYKTAEQIVEKSAAAEKQNRMFSPSDYGVGLAFGAGSLAHGNPLPLIKSLAFSYGHKMLREHGNAFVARAADKIGMNTKGQALLKYGLENSRGGKAGLLMAEQAMKNGAHELDKIPSILDGLSFSKAARNTIIAGPSKVLNHLELADQTQQLMQNPGELENNVEALSSIIRDQGAPNIGKSYANKAMVGSKYLLDQMPKADMRDPYKRQQQTIPQSALQRYARKVEITVNPWAILGHIADGTDHDEHYEALDHVYPKIKEEMIKRADEHANSGNMEPLSYRGQMSIAKLKKTRGTPQPQLFNDKAIAAPKGNVMKFPASKAITGGGLKTLPGLQMNRTDKIMTGGIGAK